jgi:hypothetical protein
LVDGQFSELDGWGLNLVTHPIKTNRDSFPFSKSFLYEEEMLFGPSLVNTLFHLIFGN